MAMEYVALACVGIFAGFMNTLAGGGSLLTLPALMLLGLPADIANGTNRVAVLAQSTASASFFDREGHFDRRGFFPLLLPSLLGALVGATLAARLPADLLRPILLLAMTLIAMVLLFAPQVLAPVNHTAERRPPGVRGFVLFFAIGMYGGFAQAGVGIFLLAGLGGLLRYDLVTANALKSALAAAFTGLALVIFLVADLVQWIPGLVLAVGMVAGARLAVLFAVRSDSIALRRLVLLLVLLSCGAAWWR
jgi:uncharacterized membrane protein YfcA